MTQAEFNQMLQTAIAGDAAGGYYTSKWSGEEIDRMLDGFVPASNQNMLDNWYFPDPINQRGLTAYNKPARGKEYAIDRWWLYRISDLTLSDQGATLTGFESSDGSILAELCQTLPYPKYGFLRSKTVTISLLYLNDDFLDVITATGMLGNTIRAEKNNIVIYLSNYDSTMHGYYFDISILRPITTVTFVAAKLELGSSQTIAYKDSNGNWLLNDPPPNKALELTKCQQYQIIEKSSNASMIGRIETDKKTLRLFIPSPVTPRMNGAVSIPNLVLAGNGNVIYHGNVFTQCTAKCNGVELTVTGDFTSIGSLAVVSGFAPEGYTIDMNS